MNKAVKLIVRPEAETDIKEAYQYYEECSEGLGADFLLSVDAILSLVKRNPAIFQKIYKDIRRGLLQRFPFGVYYLSEKERIVVIGVLHCKRAPQRWQERV